MKKRIRIDSAILSLVIIFTGFIYVFPGLYPRAVIVDNVFNAVGLIVILKGTLLRMVARGHKKKFSEQGKGLVTTGFYSYVRNPMYLGSFLMGCGFALVVWPFWSLPFFALLFYLRFNKQIVKEEKYLEKVFGEDYTRYCSKVPRLFPSFTKIMKANIKKLISLEEAFSTKEKRGLVAWPLMAIVLDIIQKNIVFGTVDISSTVITWLSAILIFVLGFIWQYNKKIIVS